MTLQSRVSLNSLVLASLIGASALYGIGPAAAAPSYAAPQNWITALSAGEIGPFKSDAHAGAWLNGFALVFHDKCRILPNASYLALDAVTNLQNGAEPEAGVWARRGHRDGSTFLAGEGCSSGNAANLTRSAASTALVKVALSRLSLNPIPAYVVRIDNKTGEAIIQLRLKPTGVAGIGQARLTPGSVIAAGAAQAFGIKTLNGCRYNVEATLAGGAMWRAAGQDLCKNETVTLNASEVARDGRSQERRADERRAVELLTIENRSQRRIDVVQVSPVSERDWGRDLLGEAMIAPGASHRVEVPRSTSCAYDVRIRYADGQFEESTAIDLCRIDRITTNGTRARS